MNDPQATHEHHNIAIVRGVLTRDPSIRDLPSGSVVVNYELSSTSRSGERRSVPVAWTDPSRPPALKSGDEVVVVGSVRRRFFRAGGSTQSRTEVVADLV